MSLRPVAESRSCGRTLFLAVGLAVSAGISQRGNGSVFTFLNTCDDKKWDTCCGDPGAKLNNWTMVSSATCPPLPGGSDDVLIPQFMVTWSPGGASALHDLMIQASGTDGLTYSPTGNFTATLNALSNVGTLIVTNGALDWNAPSTNSGTFQIQNTAATTFDGFMPSHPLTNTGTIERSGSNVATIPILSHSAGLVHVLAGTLHTSNGSTTAAPITIDAGGTMEFGGTQSWLAGMSIGGDGPATIMGSANVTVADGATISGGKILMESGLPVLQGTGTVIPAVLTLSPGSRLQSGITCQPATATINTGLANIIIQGNAKLEPLTAQVTGDGNLTIDATSTLKVLDSLEITGNAGLAGSSFGGRGIGTLINQGVITRSTSTGDAKIDVPLQNKPGSAVSVLTGGLELHRGGDHEGAFLVADGASLYFTGGTHTLKPGASFAGSGTVAMEGATLDAASGTSVTIPNLQFKYGLLTGAGSYGASTLAFPTTGTNQTNIAGGTTLTAGTTTFNGSGNVGLNGATLNLTGLTTYAPTAGTGLDPTATGVVNNSGTWDIQGDHAIDSGPNGLCTINNTGTIKKSSGAGIATISSNLNHTAGSITCESGTLRIVNGVIEAPMLALGGTLQFAGGSNTWKTGTNIAGPGITEVTGGLLNLPAGNTALATKIKQTGPIGGLGNLTVSDSYQWDSGGISGGAKINVLIGLTLSSSNDRVLLTGAELKNAGTGTWSGGRIELQSGATFRNDGTLTMSVSDPSDALFFNGVGSGTVINTGTFEKAAGSAATFSMNTPFNHTGGTVQVSAGTFAVNNTGNCSADWTTATASDIIRFGGNGYEWIEGTDFVGSGFVEVTGTVAVPSSSYAAYAQNLRVTGTMKGPGFVGVLDKFEWTNGTLRDGLRLTSEGPSTISGAAIKNLGEGGAITRLTIDGTTTWTGTGAIDGNVGELIINGTLDVQTDADITGSAAALLVNNVGTLKKTALTGETTIAGAFTNHGTVDVISGKLTFLAPFTQEGFLGSMTTSGTGSIGFPAGATINGGSIFGATVTGNVTVADGALGSTIVIGDVMNFGGEVGTGTTVSGDLTNNSGTTSGVPSVGDDATVNDGTVNGLGTVGGDLNINGGTVTPGSNTNGTGTTSVNGAATFGPGGLLDLPIFGPNPTIDFGKFVVSGTTTANGNIVVQFPGSYVPQPGNTFPFLGFGGPLLGNFGSVLFPPGVTGTIEKIAGAFTLVITEVTLNKYIGANGGSWNDAANWSKGAVPTASDTVEIDSDVVIVGAAVAQSIVISSFGSLEVAPGATLNAASIELEGQSALKNLGGIATFGDMTCSPQASVLILSGRVIIDGGFFTLPMDVEIGGVTVDPPELEITGGATGTALGDIIITPQAGQSGKLKVSGPGSVLDDLGSIRAMLGMADIEVINGGRIRTRSASLSEAPGSSTSLEVDGADSEFKFDLKFNGGNFGDFLGEILNGGALIGENFDGATVDPPELNLGEEPGSTSSLSVDGINSGIFVPFINVGPAGQGAMTESNGAQVIADQAVIGSSTPGSPLSGFSFIGIVPPGTPPSLFELLLIQGSGVLSLTDGATVNTQALDNSGQIEKPAGIGTATIEGPVTSDGMVVNGAGSLLFVSPFSLSGGVVSGAPSSTFVFGGGLNMTGGLISGDFVIGDIAISEGTVGPIGTLGGSIDATGGEVTAPESVLGDVSILDGSFLIDGSEPDRNIAGNLLLYGECEFVLPFILGDQRIPTLPLLDVQGDVTVGGSLVVPESPIIPFAGTYPFLTWGGSLSGAWSAFLFPPYLNGFVQQNGNLFELVVLETNTFIGPILGDWNLPANWSLGTVPGSYTDVHIPAGVVSINGAATAHSVTISGTGNMTALGGTLTVETLTIGGSGSLGMFGGKVIVTHLDTLPGGVITGWSGDLTILADGTLPDPCSFGGIGPIDPPSLILGDGAQVVAPGPFTLSPFFNSNSDLTVGPNALLDLLFGGTFGLMGTTSVEVQGGGKISGPSLTVADAETSEATVTVEGEGSELDFGDILMGKFGLALLDVFAGGVISSHIFEMAAELESSSVVTVDGPGSTINAAEKIIVGGKGSAELIVENGATLTTPLIQFGKEPVGPPPPAPPVRRLVVRDVYLSLPFGYVIEDEAPVYILLRGSTFVQIPGISVFSGQLGVYIDVSSGEPDPPGGPYLDTRLSVLGDLRTVFSIASVGNGGRIEAPNIFTVPGQTVRGNGTIESFLHNGGLVTPGGPELAAADIEDIGELFVEGTYEQSISGVLEIELAGDEPGVDHDALTVSGVATLGGALEVLLADGFEPAPGDDFEILTAASISGTFDVLTLPPQMEVVYESTRVRVRVPGVLGDLDGDGHVTGADLGLLLGAWGPSGPPFDLTGDGIVDGADLGLLLGAWD